MTVHYEYRTKKVAVARFQTAELALRWWKSLNPDYARILNLYRVTTTVTLEEIV